MRERHRFSAAPVPVSLVLYAAAVSSSLAQQPAAAPQDLPAVSVTGQKSSRQDDGYRPLTSTTGTKIEAPLRDIPQTINIVPQAVIQDQNAQSIQDVLKNVPGIGFSNGDGQRDQISIRGFTAIADQFVDGVRDDALYFRDLSNIEQIEVIKGPAAVLYGRGSSGGLINRVTKKPGITITDAMLSYGRYDLRRSQWDVGRVVNDAASWRLTGAVEDSNSFRSQGFIDRRTIAPSVAFKLAPRTSLLLQADYLEDRRVNDFGIPSFRGRPVDVAPSTYYGAANAREADYVQSRVYSTTATLAHAFNDTLAIRNVTRYYNYTLDRNNTNTTATSDTAGTATLSHSNVLRDEHGIFNQTELTQKVAIGSTRHQFLYGLELSRQNKALTNWTRSNVATVSLFNPILPIVFPTQVAGAPATSNYSLFDTTGVYVQDLMTFTPEWKALVGMRYDRFDQHTDNRLPTSANPATLDRVDNTWNPRAGVTWQPSAAQSYYASVSRSYQPSGETFALATNNADISPEKTTNKEVGGKFDMLDNRASLTTSIFQLERSGIKAVDIATNRLLPIGTQRTNGVELTFNADLGAGFRAIAGYAFLDAKITESPAVDSGQAVQGKRATITPRHSANLWLTREFGNGFGGGAGANYVGSRFANPGNTVTLDSYVTVDAALWYRLRALVLQLNLYNLFNERYIVSGHGTSPFLNTPGSPRTAIVSARYSF